jgi:hypothetical protein
MWEPRRLTTLWASAAGYRDSLATFPLTVKYIVNRRIDSELLRFLGFVHRPYSKKIENITFRKLELLPSSGEGEKAPTLLDLIEKANLNNWRAYVSTTIDM